MFINLSRKLLTAAIARVTVVKSAWNTLLRCAASSTMSHVRCANNRSLKDVKNFTENVALPCLPADPTRPSLVFCECIASTLKPSKRIFKAVCRCGSHQAPKTLSDLETFSSRSSARSLSIPSKLLHYNGTLCITYILTYMYILYLFQKQIIYTNKN